MADNVAGLQPVDLAQDALHHGRPLLHVVDGTRLFAEPLLPLPRLVIAGGGHVAVALAPIARAAGFAVTVLEDRPEYAQPERFPGAAVLCLEPSTGIAQLKPDTGTFVVIVTRTHETDLMACQASLQWPTAYVGMIGSRRKVAAVKQVLVELSDVRAERLQQLHAPVGLDIGAETPAEIAVSIVAELIAMRRGGTGLPLSAAPHSTHRTEGIACGDADTIDVWLALAQALREDASCALTTIVQVKGSTPRTSGASMLVYADGRCVGSIGGGKREAELQTIARSAIVTGLPILCRLAYTEEQDALCGGVAEVLIEPISL
ncbi:MAG: XdhC family protein [Mycobacterium leprae]